MQAYQGRQVLPSQAGDASKQRRARRNRRSLSLSHLRFDIKYNINVQDDGYTVEPGYRGIPHNGYLFITEQYPGFQ